MWEYTGRARRGYFAAGLSGIQFIREEDYGAVLAGLNAGDGEPVWLHANDPNQAWGNLLPHETGRSFLCVPGTAVCLLDGSVAALLERGGETLRLFAPELAAQCLAALARDFLRRNLYAGSGRLVLRHGAEGFEAALERAGFVREALDWVLWREG